MEDTNPPLQDEEYRVGAWNGSVGNGKFHLRHDSMDVEVTGDVLELEDLDNLLAVLLSKEKIVRGDMVDEEKNIREFNSLVNDLEARTE